jgi:hypothetical protein
MNLREQLIEIVKSDTNAKSEIVRSIESVSDVEDAVFDSSYIQFLSEQIALNARGPEWTNTLQNRKEALSAYCDVHLLRGVLKIGNQKYTIRVHPEKRKVIYTEKTE